MSGPPGAVAELTRRERRKLEMRNRILSAALELFNQHGFADTTVVSICDKADIAHKTFFNHFPSHQELLREIASVYLDVLLGDIQEARKQTPPTRERILLLFERVA